MKPFDLEAAKRGEPMVTRDGRKVIHFHHIETDTSRLCCVYQVEGIHAAGWIPKTGRHIDGIDGQDDLFMAPKRTIKYLNVYDNPGASYPGNASCVFDSKADAEANADRSAIKVLVRAMPIDMGEVE